AVLAAAAPAFAQAPNSPQSAPAIQECPAFRATHYDLTASIDPATQTLAADVKVDFVALSPSHVVQVELHPNLKVSALKSSSGKIIASERDDQNPLILRVTLADLVLTGSKVTIDFQYSGPLVNEENSPVRGVTLASINPQGAYLLLPARWFPLTDYPSNRFTAVFNISVPQDFAVVGTGVAQAPTTIAGSLPVPGAPAPVKTKGLAPMPIIGADSAPIDVRLPPPPPAQHLLYTFHVDHPEAAGTFVAGALQLNPVKAEGLDILAYVPVPSAATAPAYGQMASNVATYFTDQWGPLPDTTLSVAQLPDGTLPSFTAPGLVLISHRLWADKPNPVLLANLIASQWWGVQVMAATPNDVWITDGLARYAGALYAEETSGVDAMDRAVTDFAVGSLMFEDAAPIAEAARLAPYSDPYRSVVVNKGAMVFHMLRAQIGDDAFHSLLRDFYVRYQGSSASIADFENMAIARAAALPPAKPTTTGSVVLSAGSASRAGAAPSGPLNLRPFFSQWLHSTGVPEFGIQYIVYRVPKGFKIVGKITQNLDFFHMPVEVEVVTEGNPEYKMIDVNGTSTDFAVETFGRPTPNGVKLDPHNHILKSSPALRVRAIIATGEDLAEQGHFYEAVRQYQDALNLQANNALASFRMGEAFFYQKNFAASAQAFRNALDGETDSTTKWVDVWSHIYLGKIYDISGDRTRAVNEYSKAHQTNDDTSGAQAEAQKYLKQPYQEPGTAPASAAASATTPAAPAAAPATAPANPSGGPTLQNRTDPQHLSPN
ncbi:MAG: M1 family aminopeptidase, partial [Candidatus Acidiferrales bacterium]